MILSSERKSKPLWRCQAQMVMIFLQWKWSFRTVALVLTSSRMTASTPDILRGTPAREDTTSNAKWLEMTTLMSMVASSIARREDRSQWLLEEVLCAVDPTQSHQTQY